uniref:DUF5641 domain-containing protein n=3 Tax=Timema TaxID=61471 RepID=A0A7R9B548_TIMSH|nr:unnamed protein product [Timema shepardi]
MEERILLELAVNLKSWKAEYLQPLQYRAKWTVESIPIEKSTVEILLQDETPSLQWQLVIGTELVFPACVVNGTGVSKTFQILYRNEEVLLNDVIMFRVHILVDSHKIEDTLERADFTLLVELWFTDQTFGPDQHSSISCVSSRSLQLNFSPTKGLHYHLPVLFDYFHLAAVTLTIHASLVALHQPYIK